MSQLRAYWLVTRPSRMRRLVEPVRKVLGSDDGVSRLRLNVRLPAPLGPLIDAPVDNVWRPLPLTSYSTPPLVSNVFVGEKRVVTAIGDSDTSFGWPDT